ncbi:MAG: DsbA family oxidoreductase [Hyphomicrobiales bacterium]|nr:DsbA family oxidoreductase [Hyphomicrobiales bacterium]
MVDDDNRVLTVDVVSDVMCPWCFIGKRRLEVAVAERPDIAFDVRWRPFQLDATIPEEGMDRQTYLSKKFGGPARAAEIYENIRFAGEADGLDFAFDRIEKSPNTLNAHRLIRWASSAGAQDGIVEDLFTAFFLDGEDIGDIDTLIGIGARHGLDPELVRNLFGEGADGDLIEREIALAHKMGVEGVPCFILNDRFIVMGAQSSDVLVQAFDHALAESAAPETEVS